ncbi:hypothetical protein [Bacillus toyonensis]|uniref:hypothetical protein n=1 Tax=Bacillus toyonensis TaxID=155322 RepID=UPI00211D5758|nr:hypothetical protein [Bacillus toyonensis]
MRKRKESNRTLLFFFQLNKLLSGKNLNSDADLQASNYALNMLSVQTKDISRWVYSMKNIDWDYVAPHPLIKAENRTIN